MKYLDMFGMKKKRHCVVDRYYIRDTVTKESSWIKIPAWLDDLPYLGIAAAKEVAQWKQM